MGSSLFTNSTTTKVNKLTHQVDESRRRKRWAGGDARGHTCAATGISHEHRNGDYQFPGLNPKTVNVLLATPEVRSGVLNLINLPTDIENDARKLTYGRPT